jgi:hypothetical protein
MANEVKKTSKKKTGTGKSTTRKKKTGGTAGKEAAAAKPVARSRKVAGTHKTPALAKQFESRAHEQVRDWIAEAAYFRAEKRNFAPGAEVDDWLAAEQQIMEHLQH